MSKILVDAFGGDYAPLDVIKGVLLSKEKCEIDVSLVGNKNKIRGIAEDNELDINKLKIIDCETEITGNDDPMEILKSKSGSSMSVGLHELSEGNFDIFVSAGNSGALLVGTNMIVKRAPGIRRIAFAPIVPKLKGNFLLLDAGANAQCSSEILHQFAFMGVDYFKKINNLENPKVGLLNIGSEENKGDSLRKETYQLLKSSNLNFIGNIEPTDILLGDCDVVISDGFSGNIMIKSIEATIKTLVYLLKKDISNLEFLKNNEHTYLNQKKFAQESYSVLLGANRNVIKLHSSINSSSLCEFLVSLNKNL